MKSCALVGAVEFNATHFCSQDFDRVIAIDGGYTHLQKIGVHPDRVVGDFDSLGYVPDHPDVLRFPCQKDESDIELALLAAVDEGCDLLLIYGCLGGRFDFTYAVYQLIAQFAEKGKRVFVVGEKTVVTALVGDQCNVLAFDDRAKGTISLFAASEELTGVNEEGLEYSLANATLKNNKPLGVSNAFSNKFSTVSVKKGTALVFFPVKAWSSMLLK